MESPHVVTAQYVAAASEKARRALVEQMVKVQAAARREGVIEGLRMAVEAVATDDPKDAWAELSIRAELERLKAEG